MPIEPGTGAYPAAFRARELADRETLISLIVAAIADDFADDDSIRFALAKQYDFVVTQQARDYVIRKKAEQVFDALLSGMKSALLAGDTVSINGFGTLHVEGPSRVWPVKVRERSATMEPVFDSDEIIIEHRTAAVAGGWAGGAVPMSKAGGLVAGVNAQWVNYQTGQSGPIDGREVLVTGSWWGVENSVLITGTGQDEIARQYVNASLSIVIAARIELQALPGGDAQAVYHLLPDQSAAVNRVLAYGDSAPDVAGGDYAAARSAALGRLVVGTAARRGEHGNAMAVDEWSVVADRVPTQEQITNGYFAGVPAAAVLPSYPRWVPIVRILGEIWEVRKIPKYDYKQIFANRETELRDAGIWPERKRGDYLTVRFSGRQELIDALNNPIISNQ